MGKPSFYALLPCVIFRLNGRGSLKHMHLAEQILATRCLLESIWLIVHTWVRDLVLQSGPSFLFILTQTGDPCCLVRKWPAFYELQRASSPAITTTPVLLHPVMLLPTSLPIR